MQALELSPGNFPDLFISHSHRDHTAGMSWICRENPSVKCHLPSTYFQELKDGGTLPPHSTGYDQPTHIHGPFYSTGDQFPAFHEQGLVVHTRSGGVLITGCGHPGPTHCTGDHSIAYLKSSFGEGYMAGGAGQVLILE